MCTAGTPCYVNMQYLGLIFVGSTLFNLYNMVSQFWDVGKKSANIFEIRLVILVKKVQNWFKDF